MGKKHKQAHSPDTQDGFADHSAELFVQAPLSANDAPGEAARKILARQFSKLCALEQDVRAGNDAEAVHDMRVACRRMNSAFRLLRDYLPHKHAKKTGAVLKKLRAVLGEARNYDVLGENLEKYCAGVSEQERDALQPVAGAWKHARNETQSVLLHLLASSAYEAWKAGMQDFLYEPADAQALRVAEVLPALIWQQYGILRSLEMRWSGAALAELHALRIDIKRLRYTLEFFSDAFGEKPQVLKPLVDAQDCLGAIQDAVVAGHELEKFETDDVSAAESHAMQIYAAYLQDQIASLRANLPDYLPLIFAPAFREQLGVTTAKL